MPEVAFPHRHMVVWVGGIGTHSLLHSTMNKEHLAPTVHSTVTLSVLY